MKGWGSPMNHSEQISHTVGSAAPSINKRMPLEGFAGPDAGGRSIRCTSTSPHGAPAELAEGASEEILLRGSLVPGRTAPGSGA